MFIVCIVVMAAGSYGPMVNVACRGGNLRTHSWTIAVREAVTLRKEAF